MGVDTSNGNRSLDYAEHERTYAGVKKGLTIISILTAMLLILLAIVLL